MLGAVRATGVASPEARSRGKLWAFFYFPVVLLLPAGSDYIITFRCRALIWYYSTRLLNPVVSEPSTEASVAWLLIVPVGVPAIHPI